MEIVIFKWENVNDQTVLKPEGTLFSVRTVLFHIPHRTSCIHALLSLQGIPLYCMLPSSILDYYDSPPTGLPASTLSPQLLPSPHRLWPQTEMLFLQIFLTSCP